MSKFWKLLSIGTFFTSSLLAMSPPEAGQFELNTRFWYVKPSTDDTYFVISSPYTAPPVIGTRYNNDLEFQPAFRVGAAYGFEDSECHRYIKCIYGRAVNRQFKTVTGDNLWATLGNPDFTRNFESYSGFATSENHLLYQDFELYMGQRLGTWCKVDFVPKVGLLFAYMSLDKTATYNDGTDVGVLYENSKTWGIGPEIGFEFYYLPYQSTSCTWPDFFRINTLTSMGVLACHTNEGIKSIYRDLVQADVQDYHTWRLINDFRIRLSLEYGVQFPSFGWTIELGYEMDAFIRAFATILITDDSDANSSTNYYNLGMQGFYLATTFKF